MRKYIDDDMKVFYVRKKMIIVRRSRERLEGEGPLSNILMSGGKKRLGFVRTEWGSIMSSLWGGGFSFTFGVRKGGGGL